MAELAWNPAQSPSDGLSFVTATRDKYLSIWALSDVVAREEENAELRREFERNFKTTLDLEDFPPSYPVSCVSSDRFLSLFPTLSVPYQVMLKNLATGTFATAGNENEVRWFHIHSRGSQISLHFYLVRLS